MEFHFDNLSFGIIIFYAIAAVLFVGTWLLIVKNILKHIFKEEFKMKTPFVVMSVIFFVVFMILCLLDHPYGSNR